MKINKTKHRKFYITVIIIVMGISLIVDTFITMETYWTDNCSNANCSVCNELQVEQKPVIKKRKSKKHTQQTVEYKQTKTSKKQVITDISDDDSSPELQPQ